MRARSSFARSPPGGQVWHVAPPAQLGWHVLPHVTPQDVYGPHVLHVAAHVPHVPPQDCMHVFTHVAAHVA